MTDDQLREACARALGFKRLNDPKIGDILYKMDPHIIYRADSFPLDGNTAMTLLMLPPERFRYKFRITPDEGILLFAGKPFWRAPVINARNIILACLLALGEIKPEDVSDG